MASAPSYPHQTINSRGAIVSPNGLIHILGYSPEEGCEGTRVTARVHWTDDGTIQRVRMIIGNLAVRTSIERLPLIAAGTSYGVWNVEADAPAPRAAWAGQRVFMTIQVLDAYSQVLDTVVAGEFEYRQTWGPDN